MAESEVDTPSTPIEYESKYFEHHGVRLPPFCRGKMEEIANFSLRSSDIWIVTYPKSGRPQCCRPRDEHGLLLRSIITFRHVFNRTGLSWALGSTGLCLIGC